MDVPYTVNLWSTFTTQTWPFILSTISVWSTLCNPADRWSAYFFVGTIKLKKKCELEWLTWIMMQMRAWLFYIHTMQPNPCRVVLSEAVDGCICFTRETPHGGDWERSRPQGSKNVHNFLMTVRPLSWACGHGTEMLLILKKYFDLIVPRYIQIWQSKEMSHDFVRGQSVAGNCFSRWGQPNP